MKKSIIILAAIFSAQVVAEESIMFKLKPRLNSGMIGTQPITDLANPNLVPSTFVTEEPSKFSSRNNSSGCLNGNVMIGSSAFMNNIYNIDAPLSSLSCKEADTFKKTKVLTPELCENISNCYKGKFEFADGTRINPVILKARLKVAAESISLISQNAIGQMIDFEDLKKYSLGKYGKSFMPLECAEDSLAIPIKTEKYNVTCPTNVIDKGFEIAQSYCNNSEVKCRPDYLDYIKDKKETNANSSLLVEYIKDVTTKNALLFTSADTEIAMSISKIIVSTSSTPEKKVDQIMRYLKENYTKLDPVFKSYYNQSKEAEYANKPDFIKAGLLKTIIQNQSGSVEDLYKKFEDLRMSEAKRLLKHQCPKTLKISKLCDIAKNSLDGVKINVSESNFNDMLSRDVVSVLLKPDLSTDELAENVIRCHTFILSSTNSNKFSAKKLIKLSGGKDQLPLSAIGGTPNVGFYGERPLNSNSIVPDELPVMTFELDGSINFKDPNSISLINSGLTNISSGKKVLASNETVLVESLSNNKVLPETYDRVAIERTKVEGILRGVERSSAISESPVTKKEESASNPTIQNDSLSSMQNTQQPPFSKPIAGPMRPTENVSDSSMNFNPAPEVATPKAASSGNVDYNQLISKIAGLEDKLTQAQKKSSVTSEKEVDKKIDPSSVEESELVKELRSAKSALNDLNKNAAIKEKIPSTMDSENPSIVRNAKEPLKEISSASADVASISPAPAVQAASRSTASVAATVHTSTEMADKGMSDLPEELKTTVGRTTAVDNSTASLGEGVTLTRLDGVTKSKAIETINSMIVADSGKPFYIEEGGVVKQIIPEVVNGKIIFNENGTPIYKTIVKGLVGEFKVKLKDKTKTIKSVAKISSPADLKMQEDKFPAPAVRYRDLQEILQLKK